MRLLEVFEEKELKLLHEATLQILQDPGMRIMGANLLKMLKGRGLKVNESAHVARFSARLIEGPGLKMLSGDVAKYKLPKGLVRAKNLLSIVPSNNTISLFW